MASDDIVLGWGIPLCLSLTLVVHGSLSALAVVGVLLVGSFGAGKRKELSVAIHLFATRIFFAFFGHFVIRMPPTWNKAQSASLPGLRELSFGNGTMEIVVSLVIALVGFMSRPGSPASLRPLPQILLPRMCSFSDLTSSVLLLLLLCLPGWLPRGVRCFAVLCVWFSSPPV